GYYINPNSVTNQVFWERTHSFRTFLEIGKYLKKFNPEFHKTYEEYMYPRVIWSYAKTFSGGNRKDLFIKLINEYNVKDYMKKLIKNNIDWKVKFTAFLFCVHPNLFFYSVKLIFSMKEVV